MKGIAVLAALAAAFWAGNAWTQTNALLDVWFWQTATVADVAGALERGADVNVRDANGETPLHWAAEEGKKETVALLLEHGADVNARGEDGATPLHWAAAWGRKEIAALLLEHGADAGVRNEWEDVPLLWAALRAWRKAVAAVLERATARNGRRNRGWTPCDLDYGAVLRELGAC